jgi:hypothetical protein
MWITLPLKYVTNMIPENTNTMDQSLIILENRLECVEKRIEDFGETLKDVKVALLGNDFNKTGMVHTLAEHHQRLNSLERVLNNTKWLIIGLSISSGVGLVKIFEVLLKYI